MRQETGFGHKFGKFLDPTCSLSNLQRLMSICDIEFDPNEVPIHSLQEYFLLSKSFAVATFLAAVK